MVGEIQEGNYKRLQEYMQLSYIQCKEELGRNGLDFRQCNEKSGREVIECDGVQGGSYRQCNGIHKEGKLQTVQGVHKESYRR